MEQKVNLEEPSQVVPIDKNHIMFSSVFVHPGWNYTRDLRAQTEILCNNGISNCKITITAKIPRLTINKVSVLAQGSLAGSCVHETMSVQLQRLGCKVECITIKTKLTNPQIWEHNNIWTYLFSNLDQRRKAVRGLEPGWLGRSYRWCCFPSVSAHYVSQVFFS